MGVVPSGSFPPGAHTGLQCPVAADDVERDLAQKRQVARGRAAAHAAVVLAECDVEYPVQVVLHRPMRADRLAQDGRTVGAARQEIADLAFDLGGRAVDAADALDREHGVQARPAAQGIKGRSARAGEHPAGEHPAADRAAMRVVKGVAVSPVRCANAEAVLVEVLDDRRVGQGVVTLERQKIVAAVRQDLLGNRRLAPSAGLPSGCA